MLGRRGSEVTPHFAPRAPHMPPGHPTLLPTCPQVTPHFSPHAPRSPHIPHHALRGHPTLHTTCPPPWAVRRPGRSGCSVGPGLHWQLPMSPEQPPASSREPCPQEGRGDVPPLGPYLQEQKPSVSTERLGSLGPGPWGSLCDQRPGAVTVRGRSAPSTLSSGAADLSAQQSRRGSPGPGAS